MHILTVKFRDGGEMEIHTLNPGESFPRFGGSSRALVAKKTASIVTRTKTGGTVSDIERDIHDTNFWTWIAERINDQTDNTKAILPDAKVSA